MMHRFFAIAAAILMISSCGNRKGEPLEGTTWKLVKMEGLSTEMIEAEPDAFTLLFDKADTMVAGRTNCNRFFGHYDTKGTALVFGQLGMTRMACPDVTGEERFVEMLARVNHFEIRGDRLLLLNEQRTLSVFRAQAPDKEESK